MILVGEDNLINVVDASKGEIVLQPYFGYKENITTASMSQSFDKLAFGYSKIINIWDLAKFEKIKEIKV